MPEEVGKLQDEQPKDRQLPAGATQSQIGGKKVHVQVQTPTQLACALTNPLSSSNIIEDESKLSGFIIAKGEEGVVEVVVVPNTELLL